MKSLTTTCGPSESQGAIGPARGGGWFERVFLTILDTHVTSLVAAAFLFQFGSGAVRGFATTLSLGLLTNVFTSVVVSRTMFELALARGGGAIFGSERRRDPSPARRSIDVMRFRTAAVCVSAAVIAAGLTFIAARGVPLGLDFTGGTAVVAEFEGPIDEDDVRRALPGDAVVQRLGAAADRTLQIRVGRPAGEAEDDGPSSVRALERALTASDLPKAAIVGTTTVGPSISRDFQQKSASAMVGALAGISTYLVVRFRPSFAVGASVATVHDGAPGGD
jgi:preprotein translocase subunit SecF